MEFRIKVFLYNFFIDCRKMCYIYIDSEMKLIQHLVDYISMNFGIAHNIYLTSKDMYLPNFENIRILNKDDEVVVHLLVDDAQSTAVHKKSPKRKKTIDRNEINNTIEKVHEELPKDKFIPKPDKVSTKKKESYFVEDMLVDAVVYDEGQDCIDSPLKSLKKEKRKNKTAEILNQSKPELNQPIRVAQAVVSEFNRKKKVDLLPISSTPKIIKPIIVYDNNPKPDIHETQSTEINEKCNPNIEVEETVLSTQNTIRSQDKNAVGITKCDNLETVETKLVNGGDLHTSPNQKLFLIPSQVVLKQQTIHPQSLDLITNGDLILDQMSEVNLSSESEKPCESSDLGQLKKRKRKRVRTRKPKIIPVLETLPSFNSTPVSSVASSPHSHIRFDNNDINGCASQACDNGVKDDSDKEIVQIDGYKSENSQVNYEDLCDKEIVRFPIMKYVTPNKGDVIAFKRYMLSSDYTPEISNYIIGRVCRYLSDTSVVVIKVLEGKDQCRNPHGKFFIEEENGDMVKKEEIEFVWSELIEPRLLFP